MFDGSLPEIDQLGALSDAQVVDAVGGWARAEAAAAARKQAMLAEMFARRTGLDAEERELWWVDPEIAVTAELAAAMNVSPGMALHQTHRGVALRDRLPKVAALFSAGLINDILVRAIVWGTYLISDADAMAKVDAELAEQVRRWGPLSERKTREAIDALVATHDPGALRRARDSRTGRDVVFGSPSDEAGFTSMWARLHAGDAAVVERRVTELTASVCEGDPRTSGERRADAMAAMATKQDALACDCGDAECSAAGRDAVVPINTVVHVVADAAAVRAALSQPAAPQAEPAAQEAEPAARCEPATLREPAAPQAEPAAAVTAPRALASAVPPPAVSSPCPLEVPSAAAPAFVMGGGVLPASLLAEALKRATVREIRHPGDAGPEPQYRPSSKLAQFVRSRDLTCRWYDCDKPADVCDIDREHGGRHFRSRSDSDFD